MLPSNALDKWLSRFEAKYRRDPNFFMKKKIDDFCGHLNFTPCSEILFKIYFSLCVFI